MPLPTPAPRSLRHTRTIVCDGYERADGEWEVDGRLLDVKANTIESWDKGVIPAGQPIHDMYLRLSVDSKMNITGSQAVMDSHPWSVCPNISAAYRQLTGLTLKPGFTKKVGELFGGISGCTHLGSLIGPVATTVMQTMVRARIKKMDEARASGKARAMPHFLNTCHTWATTSPVVKREFPEFYKGE